MATKKRTLTESSYELPDTMNDHPFYGITLDDEQLNFANTILNPNIDIVFVNAVSGSGKTTVAVGMSNILVRCGAFSQIIYIMSPYGEKKQGWLPGTITEKSSVYFEPLYQALITCNVNPQTAINDESMVNQKSGNGYITCITDTYLRGSTLEDAVIIIDEAQNYTIPQLKKTLTRAGKRVKVIVIGHELQCDLDNPNTSGFTKYMNHFKDKERAAICELKTNHRSWISAWADEL